MRSSRAEERSLLLEDGAPESVLVAVGSGVTGEEVDEELDALGVRGDADERRRVRAASERSKSQSGSRGAEKARSESEGKGAHPLEVVTAWTNAPMPAGPARLLRMHLSTTLAPNGSSAS